MTALRIAPTFQNRASAEHVRVTFQFTVAGTERAGVLYVTRDASPANVMAEAEKAAKIAAKRAGAEFATLHAVEAPHR